MRRNHLSELSEKIKETPRLFYRHREYALFAGRLVTDVNGRKMFSIGQLPDARGRFENRTGYEFGWCGQNGRYARLFLEQGLETGDSSLVDIAVSNLDAWSNEAVGRTGLIYTHYHWMLSGESDVEDTCNLGFAIKELSEAWEAARKRGPGEGEMASGRGGSEKFHGAVLDHDTTGDTFFFRTGIPLIPWCF